MTYQVLEKQDLICPECNSYLIQNGHEEVCPDCGLVVNSLKLENSFQIHETKDTELNSGDQFVSIGKTVDNVCSLGSHIDYYNSNTFFDYKRHIISSKKQREFQKLKKRYFLPLKIKNHETDYRILKILTNISQFLKLSPNVKNRAAYFYQKIKKNSNDIRNHVSLIAFCVFYASREYSHNAPISIREICDAFQNMGHRINQRLIIRDCINYQKIYKIKNSPHRSSDYITRLVNNIFENPNIEKRMTKKGVKLVPERFKQKLLSKSIEVNNIVKKKVKSSRNPFILAGAIVYCAEKILANELGNKTILTQKIASISMGIPEYSIRDHYVKVLKPLFD